MNWQRRAEELSALCAYEPWISSATHTHTHTHERKKDNCPCIRCTRNQSSACDSLYARRTI